MTMRLVLLTALTMTAFAANSLLNRAAVEGGQIDPMGFALVRVGTGAAVLWVLLVLRRGKDRAHVGKATWLGPLSLATYMVGFSAAYLTLDAGLGALILFGVVQVTMFGVSALRGMVPSGRKMAGAMIAFSGLVYLLWPAGTAPVDLAGALLMVAAGVGWALYTLSGKSAPDALSATALNFLLCIPLMVAAAAFARSGVPGGQGAALAVLSGAVTSGMGYALWYGLLPRLDTALAAVVQLSVPVIALAGGVLFLGEVLSPRLVFASVAVLGGILVAVTGPTAPADRSRSHG